MACITTANSLGGHDAVITCPGVGDLAPIVSVGVDGRPLVAGLLMVSVMLAGACIHARRNTGGRSRHPIAPVMGVGIDRDLTGLLDGRVDRAHPFFLPRRRTGGRRHLSPFSVLMPIRYRYVNPRSRCAGNLHDFVANSGYRDTASYYVIEFIEVIPVVRRIGYRLHSLTLRNIHVYMAIRIYGSARCRHVHAANELDEIGRYKVGI